MTPDNLRDRLDAAATALDAMISGLQDLRSHVTEAARADLASPLAQRAPEVTRNLSIAITEAESAKLRVQHAAWKFVNG